MTLPKKPVFLNEVRIGEAATWGQVQALLAPHGVTMRFHTSRYENRAGFFVMVPEVMLTKRDGAQTQIGDQTC